MALKRWMLFLRKKKSVSVCLLQLLVLVLVVTNIRQVEAQATTPFTPYEHSVLIVTTGRKYSGYGTLYAEFARHGFNITVFEVGEGDVDFTTAIKTKNLAQYDIVVLHGSMTSAFSPMRMSVAEIAHFTKKYGGILVSIGFSMFINETNGAEWPWTGSPMGMLEDRFGIDFTGVVPYSSTSYYTRNGTLTMVSSLIPSLPESLDYRIPRAEFTRHLRGTLRSATQIYRFTWGTTDEIGITYYRNSTGAVGILINNQWIYGVDIAANEFRWWGIENTGKTTKDLGLAKRSDMLGRILAYALNKDFDVRIKPQPLMNIRLDDIGASGILKLYGWTIYNFDSKALTCLQNFDKALSDVGISHATIAGMYTTKMAPDWVNGTQWIPFTDDTWKNTRNFMLSKNDVWEFANHYDHRGSGTFYSASSDTHQIWLQQTNGNMSLWGFSKASVVMNPRGDWSPNQFTALKNLGYFSAVTPYDSYFADIFGAAYTVDGGNVGRAWIKDGVIVHPSANGWGARNVPYFVNSSKNSIWMSYAAVSNDHVQVLTSMTEDVASIFNHYETFYANEVGPWWLKTWVRNMTYEIPDIMFVKFEEGIEYFAKRSATISNPSKSDSTITFAVNVDNVLSLPTIGKGMLWYRIDAGQAIQAVKINGVDWYAFDDYTIRIPAQNSNIEITLGTPRTPYIKESDRKISATGYDGSKMTFKIDSLSGTTGTTEIYLGGRGRPTSVYTTTGTSFWVYNASTTMLELFDPDIPGKGLEHTIVWDEPQVPESPLEMLMPLALILALASLGFRKLNLTSIETS